MNLLRMLAVAAALVVVFFGARWARRVLFQGQGATPPLASGPAAETAPPTATPLFTRPPVRHRLAGVALGGVRYVVVQHPDGGTVLYRFGDRVPGLGRIVEVTENSATFEDDLGRIQLRISVAPSPTMAPPSPTDARPTATLLTPSPAPAPGRTGSGSPPSTVPGRSAS